MATAFKLKTLESEENGFRRIGQKEGLVIEILREILKRMPMEVTREIAEDPPPPQKVFLQEVLDFLGMKKTAFYDNVYKRLLYPVATIGNCNYYDREEMHDLLRRHQQSRIPYRDMELVGEVEISMAA